MEFRKLGRTGLKVSEICLGTALFSGCFSSGTVYGYIYINIIGSFIFLCACDPFSSDLHLKINIPQIFR